MRRMGQLDHVDLKEAWGTGHPHAGDGGNSSTCQWIFSSHENITMPSKANSAEEHVVEKKEKQQKNGGSQDEHEGSANGTCAREVAHS